MSVQKDVDRGLMLLERLVVAAESIASTLDEEERAERHEDRWRHEWDLCHRVPPVGAEVEEAGSDVELESLELPHMTRSTLRNAGARTAADLAACSPRYLLSLVNFGEKGLEAVGEALIRHGLALSPEPDAAERDRREQAITRILEDEG